MKIEEKDNVYKISMPLITDEEIRNIDNNFDNIINEFTKQFVRDKDLAIAQHLIKKQKEELENKDKIIEQLKSMNKFQSKDIKKAVDYTFELNNELEKKDTVIDLMAEQLAGLAIFDIEKEEPLILGDKEEVKQYFYKKASEEKC